MQACAMRPHAVSACTHACTHACVRFDAAAPRLRARTLSCMPIRTAPMHANAHTTCEWQAEKAKQRRREEGRRKKKRKHKRGADYWVEDAEGGDVHAMAELAQCFASGRGCDKSESRASFWWVAHM